MNDVPLTQIDRTWAAVAHVSATFTLVLGLTTGGMAALAGLLAPLGIYLYYQRRSDYVAWHALQALAFQAVGIGLTLLVAVISGAIIAATWVVVGLLSAILVGLLLVPAAIAISLLFGGLVVMFPLALTLYAVIGSYKVYGGETFEYRYVGEVVRKQVDRTPTT